MLRFIELFAGIGGFRYGLEAINNEYARIGEESKQKERSQGRVRTTNKRQIQLCPRNKSSFRCVWANEIDKYACQVYRKNFGEGELYEGDIRTVQPGDIPEAELLVGGFPCQAFSIAGKRKGFEDTRGTLFYEIARLARANRYKTLLLENVYGLLNHEQGDTFATILGVLDEMGYDVEWQVLNSKDFGVPQNRERVFIVGHLRGKSRPKVFPIGESSQESNGTLGLQSPRQTAGSLRATDYKGTHNNIREVKAVLTPDRQEKRQNGRRFKENGEPSFTLTGQDLHGVMIDSKIRRLTPTECERLQGFPDGWTEGVSDTQRYKCLGNAVTTNVITAIGEKLCSQ